jgi:hypothetical protein
MTQARASKPEFLKKRLSGGIASAPAMTQVGICIFGGAG